MSEHSFTPRRGWRRLALGALGLTASAIVVAGCGDGPTVTERREVPPFTKLDVDGHASVTVHVGRPRSVVVRTAERRMKLVDLDVLQDGTLEVGTKDRIALSFSGEGDDLDVDVGVPTLTALDIDGAADVTLDGLAGRRFDVDISGSANVRASGRVERVSMSISGSGNGDLFGLRARHGEARISGSGNVRLDASETLDARISGSGEVHYKGRPRLESRISGSGNIADYRE